MWAMFTEKADDELLRTKSKGVASAITPSKIRGGWFKICSPSVGDMLTDVEENILD
jgi:hypothetical protein